MKSESGTKKITRVIKTDHLEVSNILNEEDAKVLYTSYRLGKLPWKAKEGLSPQEFVSVMDEFIKNNYELNWSVRVNGKTLFVLFGKDLHKFIFLGDAVWWPKTSNRKKVESVSAVLNDIRKTHVAFLESNYKDKRFYEFMSDHGILRRVGSIYDTEERGSRTALFQTRPLWEN